MPRLILIAAFIAALVLAPAAQAAPGVSLGGGTVHVTTPGDQDDAVVVGDDGESITVTDQAPVPLPARGGCQTSEFDPATVTCPREAVEQVNVHTGNGNDYVSIQADLPSRIYAGPGNDSVAGGPENDSIDTGTGNDQVTCGGGRDHVRAQVLDTLDIACEVVDYGPPGSVGRLMTRTGHGKFVPVPGQYGQKVDRRILPDVLYVIRRYHVRVTAGFALTGHEYYGEHPLGLATDLVPGPGGSWAKIAKLAHWAEPRQNYPRPPFRWVGWNGDQGHGDPAHCKVSKGCYAHLHLSWNHSAGKHGHPVRTAWIFDVRHAGAAAASLGTASAPAGYPGPAGESDR